MRSPFIHTQAPQGPPQDLSWDTIEGFLKVNEGKIEPGSFGIPELIFQAKVTKFSTKVGLNMLINMSSGFPHSRQKKFWQFFFRIFELRACKITVSAHVCKFSRIILKCSKDIHSPKILDEFYYAGSASLNILMNWLILAFQGSILKLKP